ncbi:MAG: aminopeptidase P N-terminal domain-containing protein [Gemmatimonadota bacterium]
MMMRRILFLVALAALPSAASAQDLVRSDVAFPPEVYAERRARMVRTLGGPVIVVGEYMIRHGGEKKQDPDFFYLTGVESPYAVAVFGPDGSGGEWDALFLPDSFQFAGAQYSFPDPRLRHAAWNRTIRRLAPGRGAEEAAGFDGTFPVNEMARRIPELVGDADTVYFVGMGGGAYAPPGLTPPVGHRPALAASLEELLGRPLREARPIVRRMRLVKDSLEVGALRRAAAISADGLREVLRRIRPGMNDLEAAGIMEWVWKREGSPRASFGPIVASGPDAVSLYTLRSENYNAVDRVMQDGDLVFIDYGAAEWAMYTSDLCRTYPVSGRFTPEQRRLYETVLEAQEAALARIRPGVMMADVIRAAAQVFKDHGLQHYEDIDALGAERVWGLMPSPTYWVDGPGEPTPYSGARGRGVRDLGHHIGLDALDSRDYSIPLEPGMVFTVEPKLYAPDLGIAIMIEDMILVTEHGYENLSAGAPRTVEEIEAAMAEGRAGS